MPLFRLVASDAENAFAASIIRTYFINSSVPSKIPSSLENNELPIEVQSGRLVCRNMN